MIVEIIILPNNVILGKNNKNDYNEELIWVVGMGKCSNFHFQSFYKHIFFS